MTNIHTSNHNNVRYKVLKSAIDRQTDRQTNRILFYTEKES